MKAKVLIVGGGALGTSVALHAAQRCDPLTEPVVLIEKDRMGAGSSGRAAAVIHQGYSERAMAGMARDALKVYSGIKSATGRSVGYQRTGVLVVARRGADGRAQLEADVEMQRSIGIDVRMVDAAEMRALCPGIEVPDDAIGAFEPEGGFVDPRRTISTLATLARDKGAITRVGVKEPNILVEDGRAVGVQTSEGEFRAPNVVLTAGPWTPSILEGLGVKWPLDIYKVKEHFLGMPDPPAAEEDGGHDQDGSEMEMRFMPDPLDLMPAAHPVLIDRESDFSARCEPASDRTRFGRLSFEEREHLERPEALVEGVDSEFRDWVRQNAGTRMPIYRDMEDKGGHSSWIVLTPDQRPIVGQVEEIPGLWVVTGFTGNDFQLAPSIGEGLAQMIMGEPVSAFDVDYFSPKRFG